MQFHIKEMKQRGAVSKAARGQGQAALSSRGKILRDQQDVEGSFLFSSKTGAVVRANRKMVTLFVENSPTRYKLWVNSPMIRSATMIS